MLWYKSWLETRWRFLIGLGLLMFSACGTVLDYPQVVRAAAAGARDRRRAARSAGGCSEAVELSRTYRGYVWSQWFRQNLPETWTLFAVLLGTGGLLSQGARGGALFTLSLPVIARPAARRSRRDRARRAAGARARSVVAASAALAGRRSATGSSMRWSTPLPVRRRARCSSAWRSCCPLSFTDVWRPVLIALCAASLLAYRRAVLRVTSRRTACSA